MLKKAAVIFGVVFIVLALLGYSPLSKPQGQFLGIFSITTAHNTLHLIIGILAVLAGIAGSHASRLCFQTYVVLFAVLAGYGLFTGRGPVVGTISNPADAVLHTLAIGTAIYFGFACPFMKPKRAKR